MERRNFLLGSTSLLAQAVTMPVWAQAPVPTAEPTAETPAPKPFDFQNVVNEARRLAGRRPESAATTMPPPLRNLTYDQYRRIRFNPDAQVWRNENRGFTADLLHPGFHFTDAVQINLVTDGQLRTLPFAPDLFVYDDPALRPDATAALAFSGFRARHALNQPGVLDEFMVFQGASYFRAVGRNQRYGLSARGLALRTGDRAGEEFPVFTRFWIETPAENATSLKLYALLQSPSVTGAYAFTVRPGQATIMEVEAVLYPRVDISAFGISPLTSMFYFDVYDRNGIDDFRNRVHDSNGLQMISGRGERIWRPLNNPTNLQISAFQDENPKGFGLVQRKRSFRDFQDAEARYDRRPSAWIEPVGSWGRGTIDLVEIPVNNEFNDNIVAFWHPAEPLKAGSERRFSYRLHWCDQPPDEVPLGRVAETRTGLAPNSGMRIFVVDFEKIETATAEIDIELFASAGKVVAHALQRMPESRLLRLIFDFIPDGANQSEFRALLRQKGGEPISETWLYRWTV